MGGQTGSQEQQTQQTTQLPPWINEGAQQNYGFAQNVAGRPLQQYQGQMTPDTSPQLQQSWNTAASYGNAGQPQINAATAGFAGALGQTPMNVSAGQLANTNLKPYMNPFTQQVIDKSMPIYQQQLGLQQNQQQNAANAANAFGGSRQAVQQGVTQAQGAQGMAQMAAGLNQANFQQAQAGATGDINRRLTADQGNQTAQQNKINSDILASQGLNTTGETAGKLAQNAYGMQNTAGTQQMAQAQNDINAQISKFKEAWGYPTQQLGVLQSALGMTPYGQTTTGQSNTQTQTPTDWAALAGSGMGMLGSIFAGKGSIPSDRRLKKNLKKVGEHESGVPVYDYNWKGEEPGAPKTRGPMAQDVAKTFPSAVHKDADDTLSVDLPVLGALSRPAPRGPRGAMASGSGGMIPMSRTQHRRRIRPPQIRGALGG